MKHISIFILLFVASLSACKSVKYPVPGGKFSGTFRTCSLDSMVYLTSNELKLMAQFEDINRDCPNRPEFSKWYNNWPGGMILFFDKKEFVASYNIQPHKNNQSVVVSVDYGTMDYERKSKTLTLHSTAFNWTRSFKVTYLDVEKTLTLTLIEK